MLKNYFCILIIVITTNVVFSQNLQNDLQYYLITSQYEKALKVSEELIKSDSNDANLHYQRSIIYKQLYKYSESLNSIQKAIAIDKDNNSYLSEYAVILMKRDKDAEAIIIWEKVLERDSLNINAGIAVANQYIKDKKFDKAYRIYQNLYESDTLNGFFARNLGFCSIKLRDSKSSIKWLTQAIKLDSLDIKAYEYLTLVYTSLEKFDLAIETIENAIRFDPENINLYIKKGETHVMQNHNYQAIPVFEKAFKLSPENEYVVKSLGECHFFIDEYVEAKYYLRLAELLLNDVQVFQHLGDIYSKLGPIDSSIIYYNKALELVKPDYISLFLLNEKKGRSYYALNDFQKSIEAFNLAIDLEVQDILWIRFQQDKLIIDIASIYADRLNDKKTAIDYYKKVKKAKVIVNKDYYQYAQDQITKLNEELFFEGKL